MARLVTHGLMVFTAVVLPFSAVAAPQLEAGIGIGSGFELGGRLPAQAPGYLAPRVAILSDGPLPGGSTAYFGTLGVPVSIESEAVGIQPGVGILWRPSVDFAYGLAASAIFGVKPVSFGIIEGAVEGRYYVTVGVALAAQVAIDYVLAEDARYIIGGLVGLTFDFDVTGGGA